MNFIKSKHTLYYLVGALAGTLVLLYIWKKYNNQTENMMPQQNTTWKQISGETEFRNKNYNEENNTNNTNLLYSTVPIKNDTRFINGMNKYLWDKHKSKCN
jgi:glycerol uptake facilitator-like aquaporin